MSEVKHLELAVNEKTYSYVFDSAKHACDYKTFEDALACRCEDGRVIAEKIFQGVLKKMAWHRKYGQGAYSSGQLADIVVEKEGGGEIIGPEELSKYIEEWEGSCWRELVVLVALFEYRNTLSQRAFTENEIMSLIARADEVQDILDQ